ncbi:MAG: helix-turn-helix domain-containing protein, partial [Thermotaleaceae bacterium]
RQMCIRDRSIPDTVVLANGNLESVEMETISRALKQNNWNITKTAHELGISRLTLRRKIEKYSISK